MAATIKDIAKRLNVSVSTVSYALNDGPRPVPPRVRDQVLEAARELGYRPNRLARSMVTGRTATYGVVPTEASINLAVSPYFQNVLNGVLNAAETLHHDVLLFTGYDAKDTARLADSALGGRADGLIFLAPPPDAPILAEVRRAGLPFVVTSSLVPEALVYECDNEGGVHMAVVHLAHHGHRRIGTLYGKQWLDEGRRRLDAFRRAVADLGLETRDEWCLDGDFTLEGGRLAGQFLLDSPDRPTAIFCANDEMAAALVRLALDRGLRVPQDLSVVGFDDAPMSIFSRPEITTVRQPLEEIGRAAVQGLHALLSGGHPKSHVFPTALIERATVSRPSEGN